MVATVEGEDIRRLRRRAGLTQQALGERLGVDQGTVSRWERGVECPRPRRVGELRNVLLIDTEAAVRDRQIAMVRKNMVIGGLVDRQSCMVEASERTKRFYRMRDSYDISQDFGKELKSHFLERSRGEEWDAIQRSGLLDGEALLVRFFVSINGLAHLNHYEPIFDNGEFTGVYSYVVRCVSMDQQLPPPYLRFADAVQISNPGRTVVLFRGDGAEDAIRLLSDDLLV